MKTGRWQPGGFFQVDNQIFSMGLSPRDLAVYCCIAMHSNRETGVAYPSRRTIAKECGIQKVETVDRAIKVLCAKGMLEKRHQCTASGGKTSNIYTITPSWGYGPRAKEDSNQNR